MHVLITGGAGFIGSHLADLLLSQGHSVRALDNTDPQVHHEGPPTYLDPAVQLIDGDVRDREAVARSLEGIDAVVHLAAAVGVGQSMYEIVHYVEANDVGTAVLLEEVIRRRSQIQKLIVASSMSIYGEGQYRHPSTGQGGIAPWLRPDEQLAERLWEVLDPGGTPLEPEPTAESKPLRPTSIYAITKRNQEEMVLVTGAAYQIPSVALRFFNVYGARQALSNPYTGVVAIFASRLMNGRAPVIFEDGMQSRDFIDVRDVARALSLALDSTAADGQSINVGTGRATSILGIADLLAQGIGVDIEPQINGEFRAGDVRHCYADVEKVKELLNFEPRFDLETGMADLLSWLEGQTAQDRVEEAVEALVSRGLTR